MPLIRHEHYYDTLQYKHLYETIIGIVAYKFDTNTCETNYKPELYKCKHYT